MRALGLSWLAVTVTVLAHVAASASGQGGLQTAHAPSLFACLVLGGVLTLIALPLCLARFHLSRTAPLLIVQQAIGHLALASTMPSGAHGGAASDLIARTLWAPHSRHTEAVSQPGGPMTDLTGMPGMSHASSATHALLPSPAMTIAHLAAAIAIAALLAHTESAASALLAFVADVRALSNHLAHLIIRFAARILPCVPTLASMPFSRNALAAPPAACTADVWRSATPCRRGPPAAFAN